MNKNIFVLIASACLVGVCIAPTATAQITVPIRRLSPDLAQKLLAASNVRGTITVPAAVLAAPHANFACSNITVYANSKDPCVAPSGEQCFGSKWTRSAQATGTIASGCSYAITVPYGAQFSVSADSGNYSVPGMCGSYLQTSGTGAYFTTSKAASSVTENFAIKTIFDGACPE